MLKIILLSLLFILGIYLYSRQETWKPSMSTTFYNPSSLEGLTNLQSIDGGNGSGSAGGNCPNLLLQKGSHFFLYNKNQPEVEGENPLVFDSLEQYTTYINKQRMLGNHCPVLYVQQTMGAQGDDIYKVRATPEDPQGGMPPPSLAPQSQNLPSSANFPQTPYDQKMYMDNLAQSLANNLSVSQAKNVDKLELTKSVLAQTPNGCPTNIDNIKPLEVEGKTADPMTPNWGGPKFSQGLIDQGYYVGNEVFMAVT
jgi:hypothetical protein